MRRDAGTAASAPRRGRGRARAAEVTHRGVVARRHDVDDLAALGLGEHGRDDVRTEAAAHDADPHGALTLPPLRRVGVGTADAEVQAGEEPVPDRTDAEREQHRADADVAAEREADGEREQLDDRAHEPQRMAARGDRGHQTVARTRPEPGTDVQRHAERRDDDAAEQHRPPHREVVDLGEHVEHPVHDEADRERVDDRADAGALLQRDPREQHDEADEHDHQTEREAGDVGETLVEHVPRRRRRARRRGSARCRCRA